MAFDPNHLLRRSPVIDRNRNIAFCRLYVEEPLPEVLMPPLLRLANLDDTCMTYLLPLSMLGDTLLLQKLPRNTILVADADGLASPLAEDARRKGYRFALAAAGSTAAPAGSAEFTLMPYRMLQHAAPELILTGVDSMDDFARASATGSLYFDGRSPFDTPPIVAKPSINPAQTAVLELMGAVQQEAEPREIETLFNQDVTLAFKFLRYINSPYFGLTSRVESVRHALAVIGYQPLLKWLALLAATAGTGVSPALTQSAMMRARFMELYAARNMDKRDQDHLFITGLFSLLDRIMQTPLDQLLARANLPEAVNQALLAGEGRYAPILALARACEGETLPEGYNFAGVDVKAANLAHLEAIEWAAHIAAAA